MTLLSGNQPTSHPGPGETLTQGHITNRSIPSSTTPQTQNTWLQGMIVMMMLLSGNQPTSQTGPRETLTQGQITNRSTPSSMTPQT